MAFHTGTTSNTALDQAHYRDLLVRLVAAATSRHVSALALGANTGAGYTTGDILEIRHASEPGGVANTMPCRFSITAAAGAVTGIERIISAGSFDNRVVSAVVGSSGGSGYVVGDIIQVDGGTYTNRAKFRVATLSGSAVATVTLFEDGGAYTTLPGVTNATTTVVGPSGAVGTGCTLNLTTQAIVGTNDITATVITGGGNGAANFDLTLTASDWTAVRNRNNFSINSVLDEKEVVLLGTVSGGDAPYCGFRTYTQGTNPNTRYGWVMFGMDDYNDGLAASAQPNVGPGTEVPTSGAVHLLTFDTAETFWFSITGRRMVGVRKAQGGSLLTYQSFYHGLLNPYGTASESPYPFYVAGSCGISQTAPDATGGEVTGLTELRNPGAQNQCPAFFRHPGTGVWTRVQNVRSDTNSYLRTQVLYPLGFPDFADSSTSNEDLLADEVAFNVFHEIGGVGFSKDNGSAADHLLMPDHGTNESFLVPCTVISTPSNADANTESTPRGELDHVFWLSATKSDGTVMTAEDTITIGSQRYRVFTNAGRTERYSFFALKEA